MSMTGLFFIAVLTFTPTGQVDEEASEGNEHQEELEDIVVTATRTPKRIIDVPSFIDIITEEDIRQRKLSRTLPEALSETPGIMVQKTAHGQGSPYIRGFTGYRTLMLIDGIRLNNSVFRDGPNQYWNTVDPLAVSRLEVVKGPGSVLYGSDAVGGTVNAITRSPEMGGDGFFWDRELYYRFASAENSNIGRAEISGSLDSELAFLAGGSLKDFGDLRAGNGTGLQRKTGYDELDGDIKLVYSINPDSRLIFAHQRVNQDDAWRSHKTVYGESFKGTTVGDELKRELDQDRELTYLQFHTDKPTSFLHAFQASISYHVQSEDQVRVRSDFRSDDQGFDVRTLGASVQFESPGSAGHFTYGVEVYRDSVDSYKTRYNSDGTLDEIMIQGPVADDATYDLLGIYVQDEIPLSEQSDLILGTRYTYARADADSVEDPISGDKISITEKWGSVVGSARLLHGLDEEGRWKLFTGVSQGFRAPNFSDLTRFDSARSNEVETPAPDLDPETYVSYEVGVKAELEAWWSQLSYYYTDIHDMIVRAPTGRVIGGEVEVTKKNAGDGYIHGVEFGMGYRFLPQWTTFTNFTWMDGEVDGYPTSAAVKDKEPVSRLMPVTADLGLRWSGEEDRYWIEGILTLADKQDDLSARDEADTQRIPPGGTPSYQVVTLRSGWRVNEDLSLAAAVENIFNEDYRIHGSGQNEPGTNFVFSARWRF